MAISYKGQNTSELQGKRKKKKKSLSVCSPISLNLSLLEMLAQIMFYSMPCKSIHLGFLTPDNTWTLEEKTSDRPSLPRQRTALRTRELQKGRKLPQFSSGHSICQLLSWREVKCRYQPFLRCALWLNGSNTPSWIALPLVRSTQRVQIMPGLCSLIVNSQAPSPEHSVSCDTGPQHAVLSGKACAQKRCSSLLAGGRLCLLRY